MPLPQLAVVGLDVGAGLPVTEASPRVPQPPDRLLGGEVGRRGWVAGLMDALGSESAYLGDDVMGHDPVPAALVVGDDDGAAVVEAESVERERPCSGCVGVGLAVVECGGDGEECCGFLGRHRVTSAARCATLTRSDRVSSTQSPT